MGKYKCPKCGFEKEFSNTRTFFRNGRLINIDTKTDKEILCPKCQIPMTFKSDYKGPISVYANTFNSLSPEQKKEVLKKRSFEDAKKKKYVDNKREEEFYSKKH